MKKSIISFFLFLFTTSIIADDIYIKENNDYKVIKGKVLKVTENQIEYDPEGDVPFQTIKRDSVIKIVYENNETVFFDNEKDKKKEESEDYSDKSFSLELELGWNGYTGLGFRSDILIFNPISINFSGGVAGWGFRYGGGLRYYFDYPFSGALCAGFVHNTGLKNIVERMETDAGIVEEIFMDLNTVNVVNLTYYHNVKISDSFKFHFELGYAFSLTKNNYTIKNEKVLSENAKNIMHMTQPGGVIISLGFGLII